MPRKKTKTPIAPELVIDPRTVPFSDPSYRGVLPHLQKPGCTYFVTFCLADVAPRRAAQRERMHREDDPTQIAKGSDPEPKSGACILNDPKLALIVEDALFYFQGENYALSAWVVMPNHVHAIVTPWADTELRKILKSWKGFSARQINKRLGRSGSVWQKETFDHIVRSAESLERFVVYVERNPVVADLVAKPEDWPFSSARYREDL